MAHIGLTHTRRAAATLAVAAAVLCAAPGTALAAPAQKDLPDGLYGAQDPTADAVWRQSVTLLAQNSAGLAPAKKALTWLTGQQCADGGFTAYRADTAKPCDAATEDSNSTAMAVQALAVLDGQEAAVTKATDWLAKAQNDDGGWGFNPGGPTDANSTAAVIGALAASGSNPENAKGPDAKGGKTPYDALITLQLGCDTKGVKEAERGAYAYQPEKDGALVANDYATAAAALGSTGSGLLVDPDARNAPIDAPECAKDPSPIEAAGAAAAYLTAKLEAGEGHLKGMDGKAPDPNATAVAALALAAGGHKGDALETYKWLEKNSAAWSKDNPAALGTLVLTAHAVGENPREFGGSTDLVAQLNATGPAAKPAPKAKGPEGTVSEKEQKNDDDGMGLGVWVIIGVGVIGGAGVGMLMSARRKKAQ